MTAPGVAITGMGCLCALGSSVASCMEALFAPRRLPAPPRRFHTSHERTYPVFELPQEVTATFSEAPDILLTAHLALDAARQTMGDSPPNRLPEWPDPTRVGVCIGTTVGSAMNNEEFYREYREGNSPDLAPIHRYLASNPAAYVARSLNCQGPVQTVCNACSSGADAIGIATSWIRMGLCDTVIAGGADELCRVTCNGFISLMIHAQEPCRPFDQERSGLNLGEGAAMLLLEAAPTSRPVLGRVLGYGAACDAHHLTAPHPEGRGLRQAIDQALHESRLPPDALAFINAHGTGTKDNDRVESLVFSQRLPSTPFFSSKGHTGHTLGAAGAIEAVLTLECLKQGRIPASAGCVTPDPELPALPMQGNTPIKGNAALSTSLAFGGCNAALVVGKEE